MTDKLHLRREVLAEAFCSDSSRDFWAEVRHSDGRSVRGVSGVIDGVCGSASIANLWAGKFDGLLNTNNSEGRERLSGQISAGLNTDILGSLRVTDVQVITAVRKLKRAKSDGRQLLSDNAINAPSSFFSALARLFTAALRHGHVPICMRDAILQPILKGGGKDRSCSANYRGIALASSLSKILEWCIILGNPKVFSSCDFQFGFKRGVSTSMCTQFLKNVVHHYNRGGSPVYCCLLDASKAFGLVDHEVLFSKLITRDLHPAILRCLIHWYRDQRFIVRWNGIDSSTFSSANGVRQGSVLSPLLFAIYMDDLLVRLADSGVGCFMGESFCGAVCYADDLTLLAPCPAALRLMLRCCEEYGCEHGIKFNPDKTQCICFRRFVSSDFLCERFVIAGHVVSLQEEVVHLGHLLDYRLDDGADVHRKTVEFIRLANSTRIRLMGCSPDVVTRLVQAYSTAFHGAVTWSLNCGALKNLEVSLNKILRQVWRLPYHSHVNLTHKVAGFSSVYNMVYSRSRSLLQAAVRSRNPTVISVFSEAATKCDTSVGLNSLFGLKYCKTYSEEDRALVGLIREIRLCGSLIDGFSQEELGSIAYSASTV